MLVERRESESRQETGDSGEVPAKKYSSQQGKEKQGKVLFTRRQRRKGVKKKSDRKKAAVDPGKGKAPAKRQLKRGRMRKETGTRNRRKA